MIVILKCNHKIDDLRTCDDLGCTDDNHPCQTGEDFTICGKLLTLNVYDENYGQDADGNRGMWITDAEIWESDCDCEHTDEEFDALRTQAIQDAADDYPE